MVRLVVASEPALPKEMRGQECRVATSGSSFTPFLHYECG